MATFGALSPITFGGLFGPTTSSHTFADLGLASYTPTFVSDFTTTLILADGSTTSYSTDLGVATSQPVLDGHTTTLET